MVMFTNWLMIGLIIKFHFRLKKQLSASESIAAAYAS